MALHLFNTLSKKKQLFKPLSPPKVGLYTCGPTVYNFAHIGNFRAYIFEDLLKRTLLFDSFKVKHVMNITDVGHLTSDGDEGEDKMTKGLKREGLPLTLEGMKKLADKYTKAFNDDLLKLNIISPDVQPRASGYISEDVAFVQTLEKKGFAYKTADGIYFDTSKLKDYGKLLGAGYEAAEEHARIVQGEKKHPQDFALWKFNPQLGWDTKIGKGFPGWHIECSVMASQHLGKQFDIHCGGKEHIPVHHTNEIAQSEAAFGKKPWVKYWLHHEWLELSGEKMAKSGENFITLSTLQEKGFHPLDFRYFCLGTHYRKPLMFSWEALAGAKQARKRLVEHYLAWKGRGTVVKKYLDVFTKDFNDDLNSPKALATVWALVDDLKVKEGDKRLTLLKFDEVLGLDLKNLKEEKIPAEIIKLAKERLKARLAKDWKKADMLREEIQKKGFVVGDTNEGYEVKKG